MKAQHTPGPWDYDIILDICTESDDLSEGGQLGIATANAHLITTATELYETLLAVAARWDKHDDLDAPLLGATIRAVILKAQGGDL